MKGLISTIQRYSLRDGPGIRTTVFLMGCNLHCLWCSNPELIIPQKKVMVFPRLCTGCKACLFIDNEKALVLEGNTLSFDSHKNLEKFIQVCPFQVFVPVGEEIETMELARRLMRDRLFFENSKGGVTFSGGEPLLQSAFVTETARILHSKGISVAIDTAGYVDYQIFSNLNPYVDLYLFDIKSLDQNIHEKYTGKSNVLILENLKRLIDDGKNVVLRMVIVPNINDGPRELEARLHFMEAYRGKIGRIDLLSYHKLGVGKYAALGEPYLLSSVTPADPNKLEKFAHELRQLGFVVHIEQAI